MADLALLALALFAVAAVTLVSRRDDDGNNLRGERDLERESGEDRGVDGASDVHV